MTIPETLRQASEALQQVSVALAATAQAMEDAPGPEPAPAVEPEPEPGEWRNDRAPTHCDEGRDGMVWCMWGGDTMARASGTMMSNLYAMKNNTNPYWAPGNRPAPKSPPPDVVAIQEVEPQPDASPEPGKSRTGGWIVDRQPTREDADADGQVRIPGARQDELSLRTWTSFYFVHPGTPWCSPDCLPAPWDPTCLDRNGWIRSRLPTVEDTGYDIHVLIPVGNGGTTATIAYHLIVPGQPWAPWGSSPGRFEK